MSLAGRIILILAFMHFTTNIVASARDYRFRRNMTPRKLTPIPDEEDIRLTNQGQIIHPHECKLFIENKTILDQLEKLGEDIKLVVFLFTFRGIKSLPESVSGKNESEMFKPYYWVMVSDPKSTQILLLNPTYDLFSYYTVELRQKTFKGVDIKENPNNCLDNVSYGQIESLIREMVMHEFKNKDSNRSSNPSSKSVCNVHIRDKNGADFAFYCCQQGNKLNMTCDYIGENAWFQKLGYFILALKIIFLLFFPLLFPTYLHQVGEQNYFFLEFPEHKTIAIEKKEEKEPHRELPSFSLDMIRHMPDFKREIQGVPIGETRYFTISSIVINVKNQLNYNFGIVYTLYKNLFLCKLGYQESMKECCQSNVCNVCPCENLQIEKQLTWHTCCKGLMRIVMLLILFSPCGIRLYVYYKYEQEEVNLRKQRAIEKGFNYYMPNNLMLSLTPTHSLYIICYVVVSVVGLMLSFVNHTIIRGVVSASRNCIQEAKLLDRGAIFGNILKILQLPFVSNCWLFALLMYLYLVPLSLFVFVFTIFPTIFLAIKLLFSLLKQLLFCLPLSDLFTHCIASCLSNPLFNAYNTSDDSNPQTDIEKTPTHRFKMLNFEIAVQLFYICKADLIYQSYHRGNQYTTNTENSFKIIVTLICFAGLLSFAFISYDLVTFYIDLFVYTFIGFFLYADYLTTYVSISVMVLFYAKNCFGFVSKQYRSFYSALSSTLVDLIDPISKDIYSHRKRIMYPAFAIPIDTEQLENHNELFDFNFNVQGRLISQDGSKLIWYTRQVLYFFKEDENMMIPYNLFLKACKMKFGDKPGQLKYTYFKATLQFLVIVGFLLFVGVIVITFGKNSQMTALNQLAVTIAGGALPFIVKNIILQRKSNDSSKIKEDINFKVALFEVLDQYSQSWQIEDIQMREAPLTGARIETEQDHFIVYNRKKNQSSNRHRITEEV